MTNASVLWRACRSAAGIAVMCASVSAPCPLGAQSPGGGSPGLPPRDEWQRVPEILAALGIAEGQRVADVAAGEGYLIKALSRAAGQSGRVFAVEIGESELRSLRDLTLRAGLTNVEVVTGTASDPRLPGPIDRAVVLNSYHEFTNYREMLAAIRRYLRPGGLLVMVDNAPFGTNPSRDYQARHHMLNLAFADAELRTAGFEIVDRQDTFIREPFRQWLIAARRPSR